MSKVIMCHTKTKTFTLIEMLIVIVIIGILAAALIPRLTDVQGRARDTRRKTDLRTIDNALQVYRLDNGSYPTGHLSHFSVVNTGYRMPQLTGYLASVPVDPINAVVTPTPYPGPWYTGNYSYAYGLANYATDNFYGVNTYMLVGQLESRSDPDRCANRKYRRYETSWTQWCGSRTSQIYEVSQNRWGLSGGSY